MISPKVKIRFYFNTSFLIGGKIFAANKTIQIQAINTYCAYYSSDVDLINDYFNFDHLRNILANS